MLPIAALLLPISLLLVFSIGLVLGALVNWATYRLAWNCRDISPWSAPAADAPPRKATDRIPVLGWLGLRREAFLHGSRFWLRPMGVELAMGVGLALLYGWEVHQQEFLRVQAAGIWGQPLAVDHWMIPGSFLTTQFIGHTVLIVFMAAATFIDIDEKIIPDEITVPGTLLGLLLATLLPMPLLPHLGITQQPSAGARVVEGIPAALQPLNGFQITIEPVSLAAPSVWPDWLQGAPCGWSLMLGLACFGLWCFALAPRRWRGRHGVCRGLVLISARIVRELTRSPMVWISMSGFFYVVAIWWLGGEMWRGLLSSLVGMVVSGSTVWAVRIVGTAALRREAMGFGDVTLMMMIGTYLGWQAGLMIFFVSPFAGLLVGMTQIVLRRGDVIPYGPFLCLGSLAVIVYWGNFWNPETMQPIFGLGWLMLLVMAGGMLLLGVMLAIWRMLKMWLFGSEFRDR
jgi:leader peptidase (prepilin peptidase)/N-methyltransferase